MMDDSQSERFYSKMMTYSGFIIIFFALMLSMFSNDFVVLLARDKEYWAASKIIPILSLSMGFDMFRIVAIIGLNISKKTKIISMIIIVISILNILLNIVLIPIWQYVGAAMANLVSHIIFFLMIYYFSQKHYPLAFEIQKIVKIVLVSIILYILSVMTLYINYTTGIVMRILLLFSYPFILYMWSFYEEIEIDQAKTVMKKLIRLARGK
jgi:O-antigen/teichoic acid export membrane protein